MSDCVSRLCERTLCLLLCSQFPRGCSRERCPVCRCVGVVVFANTLPTDQSIGAAQTAAANDERARFYGIMFFRKASRLRQKEGVTRIRIR